MQRKRHINFKDKELNYSSSGRLSSILHSIPTLLLHNRSSDKQMKNNLKSNVLYSIPCVKSCACTFCILLVLGLLSMVVGSESCYAVASTSLTIDGGSSKAISETIAPNETKYVSSNVSYSATDTSAYTLKLTYANGSSALALDNGSGSSSGSTTTIPDVVNNTTGSDISNAWGYTWVPSNTPSSSYSTLKYNAIPAYGSSTNIETGTTISSTTKQLVFAANLSDSNPTGHYKTNLLLSLVATPTATTRTLTYNANSGSPTPTAQTCADYGDGCTITMSYTTPTRSGYTFKGWGDSTSTVNSNYGSGKTIKLTANKTIYAVWESTDPWANITTMQQMTTSACSAASVGKSKPLTDSRDSSTYTVQKMADGKCWMTSNLKITGTIQASESDFTSPTSITIPNSISGFTSSDQYTLKGYVSGNTGYYNWYTATAQAGTSSIATDGTNVSSSICPKNWTLPTGMVTGANTTNDFYNLFKNMGLSISGSLSATSFTNWGTGDLAIAQGSPYNFAYTGYVSSGSLRDTTSNGCWWSRTAYGSTIAYYLHINSSYVYPGATFINRHFGSAVRCVAK